MSHKGNMYRFPLFIQNIFKAYESYYVCDELYDGLNSICKHEIKNPTYEGKDSISVLTMRSMKPLVSLIKPLCFSQAHNNIATLLYSPWEIN